jgi:ketosteroid isomerase-like protein
MKPGIEERLRLLEDERDIQRTLYTYGHAIDYGYEEDFVDCWTEDAELTWYKDKGPITGHAALRAAFRAHTHAPATYHKHLLIEPLIRIDGDRAEVDSMFARLDPYDGIPKIRAFGRYRDVLVRCPDGRWRLKERIAEIEGWRQGGQPRVDLTGLAAKT